MGEFHELPTDIKRVERIGDPLFFVYQLERAADLKTFRDRDWLVPASGATPCSVKAGVHILNIGRDPSLRSQFDGETIRDSGG